MFGQQIVENLRGGLSGELLLLLGHPLGTVDEQIVLLVGNLVEEIGSCSTNTAQDNVLKANLKYFML